MEPGILQGQIVWINHLVYIFSKPKIGDLVLVKLKDKQVIKRIGKIEENRYFLVGDNQADSYDSREFGLITKENILGKLWSQELNRS